MIILSIEMKKIFKILLIAPGIFFSLLLSCKTDKEEDCTQWDYNNCKTEWPNRGEVEIKVSLNSENRLVRIRFYEGDFKKGNLLWEKSYNRELVTEFLDTEKNYSFTASYLTSNGDTIIAVDGGRLGVRTYRTCELTCYDLKKLKIDLRLR